MTGAASRRVVGLDLSVTTTVVAVACWAWWRTKQGANQ